MPYISFPLLLSSGLLWLLSKRVMCSFVPQWRRALAFNWVIVFFGESNSEIFPSRFLSSLLKLILIVMKLCFLIDDNMHWALIDLFLWYFFCIHDYSFFRGCFLVACYYCFQSYMQFCASRKRLALTESVFWRPKNLDFLYFAVCVPCFNWLQLWWNCASWIDDNMHWALIDLFCDTLFVYKTIEFSAVAINWLATSAFKKLYAILCLKETLSFDWVFVLETQKFRFSLLCCLCSVFYSVAIVMKLYFLIWW